MSDLTPPSGEHGVVAVETYGVSVAVKASDEALLSRVLELTPPHSRPSDAASVAHRFSLTTEDGIRFSLQYDIRDGVAAQPVDPNSWIASFVDLEFSLGLLESYWHACIALNAPDYTFIQAGVVAHEGRLVVMPGKALTGKSTLIAALLGHGATYYSDEYAVLDTEGRVHPYAVPLPLPQRDGVRAAGRAGGVVGQEPLPIDAVVATSYSPGSEWRPRRLSRGEGVLALLSHAVPAQARAEETMAVIKRAVQSDPLMIESPRDEADAVAPSVLAEIEQALVRRA